MNKPNNTIRLQALQVAINEYMSDSIPAIKWEKLEEDKLIKYIEKFSVWQPFEYWELSDVISQVESLASTIENTIQNCMSNSYK
jgi:hypothetical protein